jgi:hypothetical protein
MTFKDLITEGTKYKANGITATFKTKVNSDEVVKLLNAYDAQAWAIDSYAQQKEVFSDNENILKMLSKIGKGVIEYKTGPSQTVKKISF